jgi:uncharacterized membrane protein
MEDKKDDFTLENEQEGVHLGARYILAAIAYLPLLCLVPLFFNREDPFIQKHAKQGFVLFLIDLMAMLLMLDAIWYLVIFASVSIALVGAIGIVLKGEIKIPFLAEFAEKFRI